MDKQFLFFTYLLENYASYKNSTANEILKLLDKKKLTTFVYDMYEMYHTEAIENAYKDLDSLIQTGKPAF